MNEYYCDEAKFNELKQKAEDAKKCMEDALSKAKTLQGEISGGTWSGEQKKTMDCFMDLLIQYHSDLVGDSKPMNTVIESMQQMIEHSEDFYSSAEIYKDLEGI